MTITPRLMPCRYGHDLSGYRLNDGVLLEDAFRPRRFTIRVDSGRFLPQKDAQHASRDSPRYGLRMVFDASPYPVPELWRPEQHSMVDSMGQFEITEFCAVQLEGASTAKAQLASLPAVDDADQFEDYSTLIDASTGAVPAKPIFVAIFSHTLHELNLGLFNESVPDRPLIDTIVPIADLRAEYENGKPAFLRQIDWLRDRGYHSIRRTRGDGDCFYRSTAFALIERLIHDRNQDESVPRTLSILKSTLPKLESVGFQSLVYEDFYDALVDLIKAVIEPDPTISTTKLTSLQLTEQFQKPEISNSIVVFLRLVTSAQIRLGFEDFGAFLLHPETGESMEPRLFCEHFVEATGKEADHVQMEALCRALQLNVDIAYLDGHSDSVNFIQLRYQKEAAPLALLYRPGHYDILVGPTP
ncbi:hypothetical protein H0H81_010468 [Sphagnurus paluster]|uniref:ubiquitinyl hydrolase 1 n=1 Tax=Sphagnurus paluster TaxID=117069 RepID=A0A9P7GPD5_9AGAR|nr:hypothetical protein H0H81_010468 [Sphagnurus paluster]